jgi:hypothetical protein
MEQDNKNLENLRQEYAEACSNHRHYSALRFGIFGVYFAVIGGISSVAFGIVGTDKSDINLALWARVGGLLVTMAFFFLEILCERNVSHFGNIIRELEPALGYTQMTSKSRVRGLKARYATYTLYVMFLTFWALALLKRCVDLRLVYGMQPAALAAIVGFLLTVAGLLAIAQQIRDTRRLTKAQFVSNLENDLSTHYLTYTKLLPGEIWSNAGVGPQKSEEVATIVLYLSFFAKLKFLLDLGVLDLSLINRMFSFRFFLVVHNKHVQGRILYSDLYERYWSEIFALHAQWAEYRRARKFPIPFMEASLELHDPIRYRSTLQAWGRGIKG